MEFVIVIIMFTNGMSRTLGPAEDTGAVHKKEFKCSMGRLKWFDRFLTNEIEAQNRFLSRRRSKNRVLRPVKEIKSTRKGLNGWESFQKWPPGASQLHITCMLCNMEMHMDK